jgi:hypothetical protein
VLYNFTQEDQRQDTIICRHVDSLSLMSMVLSPSWSLEYVVNTAVPSSMDDQSWTRFLALADCSCLHLGDQISSPFSTSCPHRKNFRLRLPRLGEYLAIVDRSLEGERRAAGVLKICRLGNDAHNRITLPLKMLTLEIAFSKRLCKFQGTSFKVASDAKLGWIFVALHPLRRWPQERSKWG